MFSLQESALWFSEYENQYDLRTLIATWIEPLLLWHPRTSGYSIWEGEYLPLVILYDVPKKWGREGQWAMDRRPSQSAVNIRMSRTLRSEP